MRLKFKSLFEKSISTWHWLAGYLLSGKRLKIFNKTKYIVEKNAPASLANRILLLQLVWALVGYTMLIGALWFATNLVIESTVRHQGEGWVSKLDELGIPIYASNDASQLSEAIGYVRNFPEVLRAQYLDVSGKKITADYTRKNIVLAKFKPLSEKSITELKRTDVTSRTILFEKGENSQMRISAPIWIKSIKNDGMIDFSLNKNVSEKIDTIGFIDIVIDYSQISTELNRSLGYASLAIALMMIIAAYIGRITVRWALHPLVDLEEPLTRLANGETNVIVKTSGDKEIARIGAALNTTISALNERDDALRRMANHDGLTGLVNRKYFVEKLEQEISRIATIGRSSALFFFDLDRFKYINDTYGHSAGDRLLIQIAQLLTQRLRENDIVARFGGDEFTMLAYNVDQTSAQEIADSFIQLMRSFVFYEAGDMLKIHFSIGISIIDDGTYTSHEYLKEADSAVHYAKSHGRDGFRIFNRNISGQAQESGVGWHERLKGILDNSQAVPYFQSLTGLHNQAEQISEVLLRIPDKEQIVLRPSAFMPAAERFGLMADFDRQMIRKAAEILLAVKNKNVILSLNLSEQFINEENVIEFFKQLLADYSISPKQFIFEIAEQNVLRNLDKLSILIPALSVMKFRFAVDDFGAGCSSFNYIKQLPVHFLKISSNLIMHVNKDSIDRISVRSIVEVAQELKMQTIAKFVPDQESVKLLRQLGIDYVQGDFIAQPSSQLSH
jgi:diguanylate cyclase (GGDEF)-like protein